MEDKKYCPCCGRHCDLNEPHCEHGKEYARTGIIPERKHAHEHHHDREHHHGHSRFGHTDAAAHYETLDTENKLIMNLRDSGHIIRFLFEGKGSQKRILIILKEAGTITQRELTERIGIQPGSASEVIGKLEDAGLILRTPSVSDRRTADIQLTDTGNLQAEEALQQRKARHQEMFSCFSAEEKEELLKLLEKLNLDWNTRYRENSRGCSRLQKDEQE